MYAGCDKSKYSAIAVVTKFCMNVYSSHPNQSNENVKVCRQFLQGFLKE